MRTTRLKLIGALLVMCPAAAAGQPADQATAKPPPAPQAAVRTEPDIAAGGYLGQADFGFRGDSVSGDAARYQRFRDLRAGAVLDRFRIEKETDRWVFLGRAHNVGYRDQRFSGTLESIGRLKAAFTWDQIPLFISAHTRSLQKNLGNGVLGVDDAVQKAIENRTLTLADAIGGATPFDMRSRRHVAAFDFTYTANRAVDVTLQVKNSERKGYHLQSFGLLSSPGGGISQELGIPMDTRTTDVKAAVEFANTRGLLSAGVNASWFDNRIPAVQFDNPLRFTDISAGPAVGRAAMWPSNSVIALVANGAYKLPARTRATAAISIGRAEQNEPFVPATSNTALVAPALERASADAKANVVSMVYAVNSRPAEGLWLNARYRYYDYANKTPQFHAVALVGDWALGTAARETEPLSVRRRSADLDASYTPVKSLALGAGYSREDSKRTYRIFENTAEDVFRMTIDSTGNQYATLRLKYEFSQRTGSAFQAHLLEEVREQPDARHYDVADRDRSRVTGLVTVTPAAWLSLNGSVARGRDDYKHTGFGLRDNRNRTYSVGFDLLPVDTVSIGASYERERYTANQYSRTASPLPNPQFTDPSRDWWIDSHDTVKTLSAAVDLIKTIPKTDIRLSYDVTDGKAAYVYGLPVNSTAFTAPATLQQLPPLKNRINSGRADARYFLRANVAVGATLWYEAYKVDDFSLNEITINSLAIGTGTVYSGYLYRPYTAYTGWLKVTYLW